MDTFIYTKETARSSSCWACYYCTYCAALLMDIPRSPTLPTFSYSSSPPFAPVPSLARGTMLSLKRNAWSTTKASNEKELPSPSPSLEVKLPRRATSEYPPAPPRRDGPVVSRDHSISSSVHGTRYTPCTLVS